MTAEELMTTYHILEAKCKELYTKMSEPLYQKYQQLLNETNHAFEAFGAFKKLEWGCVREEGK